MAKANRLKTEEKYFFAPAFFFGGRQVSVAGQLCEQQGHGRSMPRDAAKRL